MHWEVIDKICNNLKITVTDILNMLDKKFWTWWNICKKINIKMWKFLGEIATFMLKYK